MVRTTKDGPKGASKQHTGQDITKEIEPQLVGLDAISQRGFREPLQVCQLIRRGLQGNLFYLYLCPPYLPTLQSIFSKRIRGDELVGRGVWAYE